MRLLFLGYTFLVFLTVIDAAFRSHRNYRKSFFRYVILRD